jgi:hypothetical protein
MKTPTNKSLAYDKENNDKTINWNFKVKKNVSGIKLKILE